MSKANSGPKPKTRVTDSRPLLLVLASVVVMLGTQYYFTHNSRKEFWGPELVEAWTVYFSLLVISVFVKNMWLKSLCLLAGNIWVALVGMFVRIMF